MKYYMKVAMVMIGLVFSSASYASYLQICGTGLGSVDCTSPSRLDMNFTGALAYDTLKGSGCTLTEVKASFLNSAYGVDTYKCTSGTFRGLSFQVFYNRTTDYVTVIVAY